MFFTELYMVQDKSRDFLDTWDFLETRITDIKDLGKIYEDVRVLLKVSLTNFIELFLSFSPSLPPFIIKVGSLAKGALQFIWAGVSTVSEG